ncbi:peptide chain release factor N(5)-glutamine methyltransferase [Mycobacterium sp. URHB0044]|uniref:peptide chain release factor N(5)-glutamine methyltransferase n=1 Tax=Mycobacterium sp. URHB0044 TaxID=1380386 RepID=UPI0004910371|nr:peptide chain release factor N(5)-glutamine methyltransferase [Mycobacterium sp. URHB0044]
MTRLRQAIDEAVDALAAAGIDTPRVDAEQLAAHTAGVDRGRLRFHEPDEPFFGRYRDLIDARARRIPLQHLTSTAAFGPVTVAVGPGVFIPRPETESMLEWALAQLLSGPAGRSEVTGELHSPVIVDLCTGSGALAVALAHARPDARIIAVDDSAEALAYARRNTAGTSVELIAADVTASGLLADHDATVDLIVANPPYIPDGAQLQPEVAQHDPEHALFGGPDGMRVIGPIVDLAARLLRPGGRIAVEHDDTTADATTALFEGAGGFTDVVSRRDLAGRPRFVTATATPVRS